MSSWRERRVRDAISRKYSRPNKDTSSNIAIEMTSLWHKTPCFIPMQNFWQDSEHHVWIVREKSKKGERKGLIGLSEDRGRTFWGRSQAWNQQNSFNIPNPGGVAVLQEKRGGEDECMRYDEIRAEGGGEEKRRDELLMAQQVWPPLGNTGAWEEGRSPLRKGQREGESVSVLTFRCVCACGLCSPCFLQYHPQWQSPLIAAVNVTAANRNDCGPMRIHSLPMWTN